MIPKAVQNGATLLDQVIPEWFSVIDVESLDLNSPWNCVLGQIAFKGAHLIPEDLQKTFNHRSRDNFTKTLSVLEKASGRYEIGLYEYGFIEEASWTPGGGIDHYGNRRGWAEAIKERENLKIQRSAETQRRLNQTVLAQQVRAGIDAELAVVIVERERREAERQAKIDRQIVELTLATQAQYSLLTTLA